MSNLDIKKSSTQAPMVNHPSSRQRHKDITPTHSVFTAYVVASSIEDYYTLLGLFLGHIPEH